jgi:molybdopterin synthase catalytic subunit
MLRPYKSSPPTGSVPVFEGTRQVKEGQKLEELEFRRPEEIFANSLFHAE